MVRLIAGSGLNSQLKYLLDLRTLTGSDHTHEDSVPFDSVDNWGAGEIWAESNRADVIVELGRERLAGIIVHCGRALDVGAYKDTESWQGVGIGGYEHTHGLRVLAFLRV